MVDLDRTNDVELLRQVAKIQDAEIRRLGEKLTSTVRRLAEARGRDAEAIQAEIEALYAQLEERRLKAYSPGSERRPRSDKEKKPKAKQTGHGPTSQHELPLEAVVHTLDEADVTCGDCGGALKEWTGQFEDSDQVDVVDVKYVVRKHRRQKYRCCSCDHIETAWGAPKLVKGGRYSLDFAIHVVMNKFADHLPLERQVRIMRRAGLRTKSQTLWDQQWALHSALKPVLPRLHDYLLSHDVVMADETRWPMLGAKGRKTKNWFVWALVSDTAVLHMIQDSRSNEAGKKLLRDFEGVVVADGYIVYESLAKSGKFTVANDWCHVRRKLIEAEATHPDIADQLLKDIGELFLIERELKESAQQLSPIDAQKLRAQVRDERSREIVERIGRRAYEVRALKESPIAKAIRYMDNRWTGLCRFLDDPRVPITSNAVERSLRNPVLGRNNHFGSRSQRGTESAALFYSLIESARLNDVEPSLYLHEAANAALRGSTIPLPHELS